jgi:hypothetical protein
MLSPHELATLMLVHVAPDQVDTTRAELGTLLDSQLVSLEPGSGDARRPTLTRAGVRVLEAAARLGDKRFRDEARSRETNRV